MPGYSQLKKLSEQILKLGNEVKIRAERGEKAVPFPISEEIPDIDDSEDFVTGMPEKPAPPEEEVDEETPPEDETEEESPDADSVLADFGLDNVDAEMPDLSAFGLEEGDSEAKEKSKKKTQSVKPKEEKIEEPPKPKGIDGSGYSGFGFDEDGNLEDDSKFGEGLDIGLMMGGPGKKSAALSGLTGIPEIDAVLNQAKKEEPPAQKEEPVEQTPEPQEPLPPIEEPAAEENLFEEMSPLDKLLGDVEQEEKSPLDMILDDMPEPESVQEAQEAPEIPEAAASEVAEKEEPLVFEDLPEIEEFAPLDTAEEEIIEQSIGGGEAESDEMALNDAFSDIFATEPEHETLEEPASEKSMLNDTFEDVFASDFDDLVAETPIERAELPADIAADSPIEDFGIDGIEIEDYSSSADDSAKKAASISGFNMESIFGKDDGSEKISADELPKSSKPQPLPPAVKILSVEADVAILKPDIFTDNPVTSANPPYYVTEPFGQLPKTQEELEEERRAQQEAESKQEEIVVEESSTPNFADIDFDVEDYTPPENESPAKPTVDFDLPIEGEAEVSENALPDFDLDSVFDTSGMDDIPISEESPAPSENIEMPESTEASEPSPFDAVEEYQAPAENNIFDTSGMDFDIDSFGAESTETETSGEMPDFGDLGDTTDFSVSDFKAEGSALDNFNIQDTDAQLSAAKSDFELDNSDFNIPGFSEDGADPYGKKGKDGLDQVDFSGALTGDGRQRNSLTEKEYEQFKKNLNEYPLNVRIAVEDMIVKNEFTDEVIFELIDKIIKKVTARQLAGYLEKMLDIPLHVPRDYEKRSANEYEAYKSSFAYQLKSRILPIVFIGAFAAMILFCIGYLGHRYIYKPIKAEQLYKEGYALLEHDDYPQSEMKFDEALTYKSKKKWFFKYAHGYREHRQYERAELFYRNILKRFNHDKQAGLEYAQMMSTDLAEYERAEEIIKREVLDYHINDSDGILALGDNYLDWATEKDPEKFQNAFDQYSILTHLYGGKNMDLYQSRFLRYYIRTNQFANVLELKEYFYPREKSLGAADWTELSGYLLDKLYGDLPRDEEYLRGKIEDLRDMMLFAIKADPENPISNYNLSRYFVEVGDHTKALQSLEHTEKLFDKTLNLKKADVYKHINNYRLLGEEYINDHEYILAREKLTNGINLFEKRARLSNFEGDKNIGAMYSDMGNLEYFISGNLENARRNYQNAVSNKHDTPSVRYRIGYIDYTNNDYSSALNNFLKAAENTGNDSHTLLALGNTLSLKNDNYAAQSYYERLISYLDFQREKYNIVVPQIDPAAGDMVETYMKAANNLGVSLFRVSRQNGDSSMNARALVNFQNSIRYYDALTRNQETMIRVPGSNLAEQNLLYATHPVSTYEPAIYPEIPRVRDGEKGLEQ